MFAEAIATYVDHLRNKLGYTCIRYFVLVNEPNYEVKDFDRWARGLRSVAAALKKRGLHQQVQLLGPDAGQGDLAWLRPAAERLQDMDMLTGYDIHMYAADRTVRPGRREAFFFAPVEGRWPTWVATWIDKTCRYGQGGPVAAGCPFHFHSYGVTANEPVPVM